MLFVAIHNSGGKITDLNHNAKNREEILLTMVFGLVLLHYFRLDE